MKQVMAACVYHSLPLTTSQGQHCIIAAYYYFPENSRNEEIPINIYFRFIQDKQVIKMKPMKSLEEKKNLLLNISVSEIKRNV